MQLVRDVMLHQPVSIPRWATVRTAVELLRSHGADTLPVVDDIRDTGLPEERGDQVIGLADALALTLFDGEVPVEEAMQPAVTLDAEEPLSQAARRMRSSGLRQLPVVHHGRLVGLLSTRDLLSVWGHTQDPLTGLPIQHQLRRWVTSAFSAGKEVTILFLDLNQFGELNKSRGHVYGDQVLQSVAEILRSLLDPSRDCPCRYGGDEFAVATYRTPEEAAELAEQIRDRVAELCLADGPVRTGIAIGIAGGRREWMRPETHPSAMLDDLITHASRASTLAKESTALIALSGVGAHGLPGLRSSTRGPEAALRRVVLAGYEVRPTGTQYEVTVRLRDGGELREKRVFAREPEITRALATATAECLQALLTAPIHLRVLETYEFTTPHGLECVGATVHFREGEAEGAEASEQLVGASPIREDLHRTYIHAVLDATNRRLSLV